MYLVTKIKRVMKKNYHTYILHAEIKNRFKIFNEFVSPLKITIISMVLFIYYLLLSLERPL